MWFSKTEHLYQFTSNLFAAMIEKAPVTFPPEEKEEMKKKLEFYRGVIENPEAY